VIRVWAVALLCAACRPDFRVVGDPLQPLDLDMTAFVPTTRARGSVAVVPAIVDTGSPVSTLSFAAGCQTETALVLNSATSPDLVRWAFPDLHPFCIDGPSVVGGNLLVNYEAIFAGDLCGNTGALNCLQLAPHEVESTSELSDSSQIGGPFAVLSYLLLGGGSFVDSFGRTRTWPATRVPLRACINPPDLYSKDGPVGYDATLLVATGQQKLAFAESAVPRLGLAPGVPVDRIVLVGHTLGGAVQDPGPCGELQRIRCLGTTDQYLNPSPFCDRLVLTDPDSWDNTADRGAYVVFEGPFDFATISDDDPYLVGAQDEVRPRIAGIDGLLAADLLDRLEQVRVDYIGNTNDSIDGSTRVITRCLPWPIGVPPTCFVSPRRPK
jgi:hypothetical protein